MVGTRSVTLVAVATFVASLSAVGGPTKADEPQLRKAEEYLRVGMLDSAASVYLGLFRSDENEEASKLIREGLSLLIGEPTEHRDAERAFGRAERRDRSSPWPPYLRGLALRSNNSRQARRYFDDSIGRSRRFVPALLAKARLEANVKRSALRSRRAFAAVLGAIPNHPTATYELGRVYEILEGDKPRAITFYEQHALINPRFGPNLAELGIGRVLEGDWRKGRRALYQALMADGIDDVAVTMALGISYLGDGQFDQAHETFSQVMDVMPEEERALYDDISLIAARREVAYVARIGGEQRRRFLEKFWTRRDPTPITAANERQMEHYRRVWRSKHDYGVAKSPWDKRGEVYIRYGDPLHKMSSSNPNFKQPRGIDNIRERMKNSIYGFNPPTRSGLPVFPLPTEDPTKPAESVMDPRVSRVHWEAWLYPDIENGIEVTFVDRVGGGLYEFATPPMTDNLDLQSSISQYAPQEVVALAAQATPERFVYSEELLPLEFFYSIAQFKAEGGNTLADVYFGLPTADLSFVWNDSLYTAEVELGFVVHDQNWEQLGRVRDHATLTSPTPVTKQRGAVHLDKKSVTIGPGRYLIAVQAKDLRTGRVQAYRDTLHAPVFDSTKLAMSSLVLAASIDSARRGTKYEKNGLSVVPMPSRAFRRDQEVNVYFEIYNLGEDKFGRTEYQVDYTVRTARDASGLIGAVGKFLSGSGHDEGVGVSSVIEGLKRSVHQHFSLDTSTLDDGAHVFEISVTDRNSGQTAYRSVPFYISR